MYILAVAVIPYNSSRYWRIDKGKLDLYSAFKFGKSSISYIVSILINNPQDVTIKTVNSVGVPDSLLPEKNTFIKVTSKA